jgi:hypothetical protein
MMLALVLAGCTGAADGGGDSAAGPVDLRLGDGDHTPADVEVWGPEAVVAAGEDVTHCIAGTWAGGEVGIHALNTWQNRFGHHVQFFGLIATTLDYPDGATPGRTGSGTTSSSSGSSPPRSTTPTARPSPAASAPTSR